MDLAPGPSVPFWWTAYPEADNALLVNPSGTAWLASNTMRIGFVLSDSAFERFDRITLDSRSGGFTGWWDDSQSLRRFTSGGSFRYGDIAAGLSYTWYDPTVNNHPQSGEKFFTAGLTWRPDPHLGLGATARTETGDIDPCCIAGAAVRPLGSHMITLTGDYRFKSENFPDRWSAGIEIRPLSGIAVRGSFGENETMSFGVQMDMGRIGITAGADLNDGEYTGTTGEILLYDSPRSSAVQPLPEFLTYSTGYGDELPSRSFLGPRKPSFTERIAALAAGVNDPSVEGVLLDMSDYSYNTAQSEELRDVLVDYRSAGKPVYAYMEYAGNSSYYTASACRAICIHRAGHISVHGFTGYTFFLRGFLDKLGIYPELMHIGDYKNFSDMFTEYSISDAQREAATALLENMKNELVRGISEGRGLEPAQMDILFREGPFAGEQMATMGLVDTLLYNDQFEDFVKKDLGRSFSTIDSYKYAAIPSEPSLWGSNPRIAVVIADGNIINGRSGSSITGRNMGSDTVTEMLEQAASSEGVKAIVLRINSGGGDAMASDDMYHAVENIRKKMPVVVSMGSVAASGGYYMAAGADAIFAGRTTVTGSIGIISGKIVYGNLLEKLGINIEKVEIEPSGNPGNPFEPFTEDQRDREFAAMRQGYELFVNTVAEGRNMTFEEVDAIGQGRVWAGTDALELGLVDNNGGVLDAIAHASHLAGLDEPLPELVVFPQVTGLGSINISPLGLASLTDAVSELTDDPLLNSPAPLYLSPMIIIDEE